MISIGIIMIIINLKEKYYAFSTGDYTMVERKVQFTDRISRTQYDQ